VAHGAARRREALRAYGRAIRLEGRVLERYPELLRQQVCNRLKDAEGPVAARIAAESLRIPRPWIRLLSRPPWAGEPEPLESWSGKLPMAFSGDGNLVWHQGEDGVLLERSTRTGGAQPLWETFDAPIRALAYDPGEDELSFVTMGGEWIAGSPGAAIPAFRRRVLPRGEVAACIFDGRRPVIVVTHADHSPAQLLTFESGMASVPLSLEFGYLPQVPLAVVGNGPRVVCPMGPRAREVALVDGRTGEVLHVYSGHTLFVSALCPIPEYDLLATGAQDGTLRIWRLSTGEQIGLAEGGFGQVTGLVWCPGARTLIALATSSRKGRGSLWIAWSPVDPGRQLEVAFSQQHGGRLAISRDGNALFSGALPGHLIRSQGILAWDLGRLLERMSVAGAPGTSPSHHDSDVARILPLRGGREAVSVSRFGQVFTWREDAPNPVDRGSGGGPVYGTGLSPDKRWIVLEVLTGTLRWDDGRPIHENEERGRKAFPLADQESERPPDLEAVPLDPCELVPVEEETRAASPGSEFVFEAEVSGLVVRGGAHGAPVARLPLPHPITCVAAGRDRRAFLGDAMGWVWQVELCVPDSVSRAYPLS